MNTGHRISKSITRVSPQHLLTPRHREEPKALWLSRYLDRAGVPELRDRGCKSIHYIRSGSPVDCLAKLTFLYHLATYTPLRPPLSVVSAFLWRNRQSCTIEHEMRTFSHCVVPMSIPKTSNSESSLPISAASSVMNAIPILIDQFVRYA